MVPIGPALTVPLLEMSLQVFIVALGRRNNGIKLFHSFQSIPYD
jgi:hypothetical protein